MKKIQLLCGSTVIAAAAFAAPVLAQSDSGYRGPQPVQNAPTPQVRVIDKEQAEREQQRMQMQRAPQGPQVQPQAMQQPPRQSRQVHGLAFNSDNRGSGPDKTKFNIVNEDEARRQQGRLHPGGGDHASDGTGGSDSSGGGR